MSVTNTATKPAQPTVTTATQINIGQPTLRQRLSQSLQSLSTPQWYRVGLYGTCGASLLLLLSAIVSVQAQRNGIESVAKSAIPNVIQAQRLKTAMTDIDAMVANRMLGSLSGAGQELYYKRQGELSERIVQAAQIASGETEQAMIQSLVRSFNAYTVQAEQARFAKQRGDQAGVLEAYRQAAEILDRQMLPSADRLARINEAKLQASYRQTQAIAIWSYLGILLSGLLLLGSLVVLQIWLAHQTRRRLNPMLVAATLLSLLSLFTSSSGLLSRSSQLRMLKEDAYASLRALRVGRVHLYQANGAASRYLLDPTEQNLQAFDWQTEQVLKLPDGVTLPQVIAAYKTDQQVPGLSGEFADALNQISFPGERERLIAMLAAYGQYLQVNQQIRQLFASGQTQAAIDLSIGGNPGQSYAIFKQLRDQNEQAVVINTEMLDQLTAQMLNTLNGFEGKAAMITALTMLMILFGLRPRLREYLL